MPKHEIRLTIPPETVLNKDAECDVYSNDEMLGTLKISKGSIEWRPKNYTYGFHLSWEDFSDLMKDNGTQT